MRFLRLESLVLARNVFAALAHASGASPEALRASQDSLALPIYPELGAAQQRHVVGQIREFSSP